MGSPAQHGHVGIELASESVQRGRVLVASQRDDSKTL
jgi:hypothetical protein